MHQCIGLTEVHCLQWRHGKLNCGCKIDKKYLLLPVSKKTGSQHEKPTLFVLGSILKCSLINYAMDKHYYAVTKYENIYFWLLTNKTRLSIEVCNCSRHLQIQTHYWEMYVHRWNNYSHIFNTPEMIPLSIIITSCSKSCFWNKLAKVLIMPTSEICS